MTKTLALDILIGSAFALGGAALIVIGVFNVLMLSWGG